MIPRPYFIHVDHQTSARKEFATAGRGSRLPTGNPLGRTAAKPVFMRNIAKLLRFAQKKRLPVGMNAFSKKMVDPQLSTAVVFGTCLDEQFVDTVLKLIQDGLSVWIPVDAVATKSGTNRKNLFIELRKCGAQMGNADFVLAQLA